MNVHSKIIASPLSRTTMLVAVKISQWGARKLDRQITEETNRRYNADSDAGRFNKLLINPEQLAEIDTIVGEARTLHYTLTKPWCDKGPRILPNAFYSKFTNEFRVLKRRFDDAVDRFVAGYPTFRDQRKGKLGGAFKASDYPDVSVIREKFKLDLNFMPFPDVADFRSDLDPDTVADIRQELADTSAMVVNDAMKHTFDQIVTLVGHMATKLHQYSDELDKPKKKGEKRKFFTDSLVENVRDLAELLPAFNLTNDPKLTKITNRIVKELCTEDAQALRDHEHARDAVAKSADEIVAEVGKFFG